MFNVDIRDAMRENRVYGYEVAEKIGMTEFSFSRLLARKELPQERKEEILRAIRGEEDEQRK